MFVNYCAAIALCVGNHFDLVVADLRLHSWGYYSVGGPLYGAYTLYVVLNFATALATVAWDYRTATDPRGRLQLKFWLLGGVIALPFGATNLLPAYGIHFYPLGNLANVTWAGVVAYAIVRHRLMDIDIVLTKGMAYATACITVILPVGLVVLWLQQASFGSIHKDFSFAVLGLFIAAAILFPTVLRAVEPRIARSWIRNKREYRALISSFTRSVGRIFNHHRLVSRLAEVLQNSLALDRVAIALRDARGVLTIEHFTGVPPKVTSFELTSGFVRSLHSDGSALLRDELLAARDEASHQTVQCVFDPNGWEVCIPLQAGGQLQGFIALGPKPGIQAYFAEDLELLETLAAEASIALENARLYEELRKSEDIIRRADRSSALGTLAAGIAHEIRNPLVSVQTFFQLAPHRLHDPEFMTEFLAMTANEVKRISHLINELLTFARSPTPSYTAVDLNQLVERVVLLINPEARKHQLKLEHVLDPQTPLVQGDAEQLRQALINLAFNAFEATAPGGVVRICTRSHRHNGALYGRLEVHDTGCGIPPEQLDDIFNPFYTTKIKGTGLGLAIVQRIVSEHGGVLAVDSVPGVGTTFTIDLATDAAAVGKGESGHLLERTQQEHGRM